MGIRTAYISKTFRADSRSLIDTCNTIIAEYRTQGYDLTLRQLYYQCVARGYIANKATEYDRLGSIINDARLAGLTDWDAIVDRTRNLAGNAHWSTPKDIIQSAARSYRLDKWKNQEYRPEVWVEKEALAGVVERAARALDVSFFSCRGYVSQSSAWEAAQRFHTYWRGGQTAVIIHLGDHDPSGIDMTRDIMDRMDMFGVWPEVKRIALNMDQIERYNPPPNPAKVTDSRYAAYQADYGDESWELDALDPATLEALIEDAVVYYRDDDKWQAMVEQEQAERSQLFRVSGQWGSVLAALGE